MSYPVKEIVINFLSVVAGVFTGYFLFIFSGLLGYGVLNITKGPLEDIFSAGLYLVFPAFGTGYVTAVISTRYDKINITVAGLVLALVFVPGLQHDLSLKNYKEWTLSIVIVILTIISGLIGIYLKKKEKANLNKEPSPPDIPPQ